MLALRKIRHFGLHLWELMLLNVVLCQLIKGLFREWVATFEFWYCANCRAQYIHLLYTTVKPEKKCKL